MLTTFRTHLLRASVLLGTAILLTPPESILFSATQEQPAAAAAAMPVLRTASPGFGLEHTGSTIMLTGHGLATVSGVRFGATPARFAVVTDDLLMAVLPQLAAGSYRISVIVSTGSASIAGPNVEVRRLVAEVLRLTNAARAHRRTCGTTSYPAAKALSWNATLATVAARHSAEMAAKNYFSHTSARGLSPFTRIKRAHYSYRAAGENIAAGYRTPAAVVKAWLASPGHCRIMMSAYTQLGVGFATGGDYGTYWTADFTRPR